MKKIKLLTAATLLAGLTATSPLYADFLGVYAGVDRWTYDLDGGIASLGNEVDLNNDLGAKDDDNITKYVAFEHPIPFLPNVMIRQVDLRGNSQGTASQNFTFQGNTFTAGTNTRLTYNLDHDEYTLYFEILDNWVNLDLGLSAKQFDGSIFIGANPGGGAIQSIVDIEGSVPMAYGKAQFDFPFTGLSAGVQMHLGQFNDDKLSDTELFLAYETEIGLGLKLGYRIFELEFDDFDELSSDLTIDGVYLGANFHF